MKHFIHYLPREIKNRINLASLFFADDQAPEAGFDRPMYHVTRSKSGPLLQIEEDSVIWLFSALKSPWGTLPPSLDAKFIVSKIEDMPDGKKRFHAQKDSKWFPLSDATKVLERLKTIDKNANEIALWTNRDQPIGYFTQSIRQLSNAEELIDYSNCVLQSKINFISYRIIDGTKPAFMLAADLISRDSKIFWDRYCLPRRLSERREIVSDLKLDEYLLKMICNASKVYGIESGKYFEEGCYSRKEAELAMRLNKYVPVKV